MKSFLEQTFVTARPRLWLKSLKRDRLSSVCRVRSVTRVNSQINLLADGNSSQESVLQPQHKVTLTNVNAVAFITQRLPAINSEYDGQKRKIKLFFKRGLCLRLLWRMGHLSFFCSRAISWKRLHSQSVSFKSSNYMISAVHSAGRPVALM